MSKKEETNNQEMPEASEAAKHVNIHVNANDGLKELIEKNIKWSQVIYEQNRKINRRLTWLVVGSYLRLAIIIIPLILAVIFLPPLLEQLWAQYSGMLGGLGGGTSQLNNIFSQISGEQIQEYLQMIQTR